MVSLTKPLYWWPKVETATRSASGENRATPGSISCFPTIHTGRFTSKRWKSARLRWLQKQRLLQVHLQVSLWLQRLQRRASFAGFWPRCGSCFGASFGIPNKYCFTYMLRSRAGTVRPCRFPKNSTVGDPKVLVQKSFGQGFLKLVTEKGHVLTSPEDSLLTTEVQEGAHVTVVAQQPKVAATWAAFAIWCCGGDRIVTKISSRMSSQFRLQPRRLPLSCQTDPSLPGEIQRMVVTALQFNISSRMCDKFRPQNLHFRQSWLMDQSLPGAIRIQTMVATARQFNISSRMCSKFRALQGHLLPS